MANDQVVDDQGWDRVAARYDANNPPPRQVVKVNPEAALERELNHLGHGTRDKRTPR